MSVSVASSVPAHGLDASKAPETSKPEQINSINDLLLHKAQTIPNTALIGYASSEHGPGQLAEYTAKELDLFVDEAARELTRLGLQPKERRSNKSEVIAVLGLSNLDYVIAMFALSRMGFTVLFLSTRLPIEAYVSLLQKTETTNMVASDRFASTVSEIQQTIPIKSFPLLEKQVYAKGKKESDSPRFTRLTELVDEESCIAFIVHSSGSTGLPKPIFQTHRSCLSNYALGSGMRAFVTLPLFHNHGLSTMFRGIVSGKRTVIYNANLALTNANLVQAMKTADPESFHGVPYALKVLAETEEGIAALRKCKLVLYGGSSCPDDLGDKLVDAGVYLVGHYGATEMGQLMTSFRAPEDKAWNYMRPIPKVKPYLRFIPSGGEGIYECVVLDGLSTKVMSNSDDPPNSFHTRDTFVAHPTIPDAWKYLGRLDDRVTLVNGEKVLPIPYEHQIRQSTLVQDCLVFGVDRAFPGILVIPSERTSGMSKEDILNQLESSLKIANDRAEKFGYISREMVEIMDHGVDYPRTDKGTMIRAACYKKFADIIDAVYVRFETPDQTRNGAQQKLDLQGLETYLLDLFTNRLGVKTLSVTTDFFEAGTDSLQAITARGHIMRELDLSGHILGQNIVFENQSIQKLARHLDSLSNGSQIEQEDELEVMKTLIEKYSSFPPFTPGTKIPESNVILLTGATGSLGAHILSQLVTSPTVQTVYCLVRAASPDDATGRVMTSLTSRKLVLSNPEKVIALPSDLSKSDLGLLPETFSALQNTLTTVIHSAWAVNFNLGVASFEIHHIRGTYNLLRLCRSVPFAEPARLSFISSISAAASTPVPAVVEETYIADPAHAQNMGYARSKFVTEHIIKAAATTGQRAQVLRTGQIVGDTATGLWNSTEAVPLMLRAAVTIGALPKLDETPNWLPVDKCAEAVIELSGAVAGVHELALSRTDDTGEDDTGVVYHVQNPKEFKWTEDLLPALRAAGLEFETVDQREWVRRLREGEQDPDRNPTIKLVDFFADKYDNDRPGRKGLVFSTAKTSAKSTAIREGVDVIGSGLVGKMVKEWKKTWVS